MKLFNLYIKTHLKLLVIPVISMIICLAIDTTFPLFQKTFVDEILQGGNSSMLVPFFIALLLFACFQSVFGYIKEFLFDKFSIIVSKKIRKDLFKKIHSLEFSFFDKSNTGELMSRISEDVDIVWETIAYGFRLFIEGFILFTVSAIMMYTLSPLLTLVCISILLPVAILGIIMNKKFEVLYSQISDQTADINSTAQQDISGIRLVKSFAREKYEIQKFLKTNTDCYDLNIKQAKLVSSFLPVVEFLTNMAPVVMIILGGILCIKSDLSLGTLLAFSSYIFNLSFCVRNLGNLINLISQSKASMEKISSILDLEPSIISPENAYSPDHIYGEIEFKNVSFKYNDSFVLKNINLKIPAGTNVAVMGETGSGKSTLVSLMARYYDVTEGAILIDGIDIRDWNLNILRNNISMVFQDTFLFSDSISDNINFGKDSSQSEVIKASKNSCAYGFIEKLDEKYDTFIGERGIGLSGGQKQRLSIARAIIKDSPITVLDDSTSALDMQTEYDVLKNLSKKGSKSTNFIIAHRISGVKDADLIIFLKDGKIFEQGTHSELVELNGLYKTIYDHQFQDFNTLNKEVI